MQKHTYILVDKPTTPIDLTPDKPKVYQFRSTARAWRSKYKRHIGTKQIIRQFKSELVGMPTEVMDTIAKQFNSGAGTFPPAALEQCKELLVQAAIKANHNLPTL